MKVPNKNVHGNPSIGAEPSCSVAGQPYGRTDGQVERHDEASSRFFQVCKSVYKVKVFVIKHYAMRTYGLVGAKLHTFLALTLERGEYFRFV